MPGYAGQVSQERAAVTAILLVSWYVVQGDLAVARNWLGSAQRLLEGLPENSAHARMALERTNIVLFPGQSRRRGYGHSTAQRLRSVTAHDEHLHELG